MLSESPDAFPTEKLPRPYAKAGAAGFSVKRETRRSAAFSGKARPPRKNRQFCGTGVY